MANSRRKHRRAPLRFPASILRLPSLFNCSISRARSGLSLRNRKKGSEEYLSDFTSVTPRRSIEGRDAAGIGHANGHATKTNRSRLERVHPRPGGDKRLVHLLFQWLLMPRGFAPRARTVSSAAPSCSTFLSPRGHRYESPPFLPTLSILRS
jgi:hypothetical protein